MKKLRIDGGADEQDSREAASTIIADIRLPSARQPVHTFETLEPDLLAQAWDQDV